MINTVVEEGEEPVEYTYDNFTFADVDTESFGTDQRAIGSSWRDVFDGITVDGVFYIVKDTDGNFYKLQFLALTNAAGERGYPEFVYSLLQE